MRQYVKQLERLWARLAADVGSLTVTEFVSHLIGSQIEFAEGHPAFFALVDAPLTANSTRRRGIIRGRIARVLLMRKPAMSKSEALRLAAVVQQILKGLLTLYARADTREKRAILNEFKVVLTGYLTVRL